MKSYHDIKKSYFLEKSGRVIQGLLLIDPREFKTDREFREALSAELASLEADVFDYYKRNFKKLPKPKK